MFEFNTHLFERGTFASSRINKSCHFIRKSNIFTKVIKNSNIAQMYNSLLTSHGMTRGSLGLHHGKLCLDAHLVPAGTSACVNLPQAITIVPVEGRDIGELRPKQTPNDTCCTNEHTATTSKLGLPTRWTLGCLTVLRANIGYHPRSSCDYR